MRGRNKEGHFEVIAGKSLLAFRREAQEEEELSSKCFAFVQTYDEPKKGSCTHRRYIGWKPGAGVFIAGLRGKALTTALSIRRHRSTGFNCSAIDRMRPRKTATDFIAA